MRVLGAVHKRRALPAPRLFDELLAEIQQCAVSDFADDVCLLGVEIARVGAPGANRRVA
jgi:hypothetical protein